MAHSAENNQVNDNNQVSSDDLEFFDPEKPLIDGSIYDNEFDDDFREATSPAIPADETLVERHSDTSSNDYTNSKNEPKHPKFLESDSEYRPQSNRHSDQHLDSKD